MGLDQYFYKTAQDYDQEVEMNDLDMDRAEELYYFRKHNALQGFMNNLYTSKGGVDKDFNCCPVNLNMNDLNSLEESVLSKTLPVTKGFFFGSDTAQDDFYQEETMSALNRAKLALSRGYKVFYVADY